MKKLSIIICCPDYNAWSIKKLLTSLQSLEDALLHLAYPDKLQSIICTPDSRLEKDLESLSLDHLDLRICPDLKVIFPEIVGDYFLAVEADIIFDAPHLQLLLDIVEGTYNNLFDPDNLLFVIRYFLLQANDSFNGPTTDDWRRQLVFGGSRLPNFELRIGVPNQHATLAHRHSWHQWFSDTTLAFIPDLNLLLSSPNSKLTEHPVIDASSLGMALYRLPNSPPPPCASRSLNDLLGVTERTSQQNDHYVKVHAHYQVVSTRGFTRYYNESMAQDYLLEFATLFPLIARLNEAHALQNSLVFSSSPSPLTAIFSPTNRGQFVWVCPQVPGAPRTFLYSLEVVQLISQYLKLMYEGRIIHTDQATELATLINFLPYPSKYDICYFDIDISWSQVNTDSAFSFASLYHDRTIIIFRLMDRLPLAKVLQILGFKEDLETLFKIGGWHIIYPFEPVII
jgi:hypothetical protein